MKEPTCPIDTFLFLKVIWEVLAASGTFLVFDTFMFGCINDLSFHCDRIFDKINLREEGIS